MRNISFPYPVLGNNDDVLFNEMPKADVSVTEMSDYYKVNVVISIDNEKILSLIDQGVAEYVCRYESHMTLLRNIAKGCNSSFGFLIKKTDVIGAIYFYPMIVVKHDFIYENVSFHEDYGNQSFNMERGDYLAVFPKMRYDADIDFSKLRAVGSFINIRKNENQDTQEVEFDLRSDKIGILLPEDLFNKYVTEPSIRSAAGVLHSSLVMNALMYALNYFQEDFYKDTKWARSIDYRLKHEAQFADENMDDLDVLSVANKMMENPYRRLFGELINK